jgi:tripartite-type tricarboxylate transporter receptor subunit TctC
MKLLNAAVATLAVSLCAAPSFAADDSYPEKDINLIVGFAAGGGTDTLARLIPDFPLPMMPNDRH